MTEQELTQLCSYLHLQELCTLTPLSQEHLNALMCRFRNEHGENTEAELRKLTDCTFVVPDFVKGGETK